ncbi:MAG: hypothetical protein EPO32_14760 [Anaerolineae bacterium]|nr:MAG: hypothetical protein EPO32_14760 [Anaerolineae bacterium]
MQVANRRPRRHHMVLALDGSESLAAAARRVGCTIQAFYVRAKASPRVTDALVRRRERGHVRGRKRQAETSAQTIERFRVHPIRSHAEPAAATTLERDIDNLTRLQQSRPLVPPGRKARSA